MPNEICEYCNVELCCYAVDQGVRQGLLENTAFDNRLDCNYTAHGYNFSQSDIDWCADPYICGPCYGDAKFSVRPGILFVQDAQRRDMYKDNSLPPLSLSSSPLNECVK